MAAGIVRILDNACFLCYVHNIVLDLSYNWNYLQQTDISAPAAGQLRMMRIGMDDRISRYPDLPTAIRRPDGAERET